MSIPRSSNVNLGHLVTMVSAGSASQVRTHLVSSSGPAQSWARCLSGLTAPQSALMDVVLPGSPASSEVTPQAGPHGPDPALGA